MGKIIKNKSHLTISNTAYEIEAMYILVTNKFQNIGEEIHAWDPSSSYVPSEEYKCAPSLQNSDELYFLL